MKLTDLFKSKGKTLKKVSAKDSIVKIDKKQLEKLTGGAEIIYESGRDFNGTGKIERNFE